MRTLKFLSSLIESKRQNENDPKKFWHSFAQLGKHLEIFIFLPLYEVLCDETREKYVIYYLYTIFFDHLM